MIDPSWAHPRVEELRGAWTALDQTDTTPPFALQADNCVFENGQVRKRNGFGLAYNTGEDAYSIHNWVSSLGNNLYWLKQGTGLRTINVAAVSPSTSTIIATASGVGARYANAGTRMYVALYDSAQSGAVTGRVISYQSAAYQSDVLFPGPITYTPSAPSEPGVGVITAGVHYLGYVIEYRSGFKGRLCPDSGATTVGYSSFVPVSKTAAGSKNLSWTLNTTWPTGAVRVYVAMSPVSNPSKFILVPGASAAVTGGSLQSVTIVFSISDDDLFTSESEDVNQRRLLMTRNTSGTDAITPYQVFQCGDRMAYLANIADGNGNTESALFVSERNAFQEIYPDKSLIKIPEMPDIVTGAYVNGSIALFGKHATYVTSDSGLTPAEWPTPRRVDGNRGTLSINGVSVSANASYAWVADQGGLFMFDGANYSPVAISYGVSDKWLDIGWGFAYDVQVLDDPANNAVYVKAQQSSIGMMLFRWDYRNGKSYMKVDFSLWPLSQGSSSFRSLALVQNDLNGAPQANAKRLELWIGCNSTDGIIRLKTTSDTLPYTNVTAVGSFAVSAFYLTGGFRGDGISIHHGAQIRVRGSGTLAISQKNIDSTVTKVLGTITMATAPGREYFKPGSIIAEQAGLLFSNTTAAEYFVISGYTYFYSFYASKR